MKSILFRIIIAVCTFIFGIIAVAMWLNEPMPDSVLSTDEVFSSNHLISPFTSEFIIPNSPISESVPDSTVYSVKLCELFQHPEHYSGKIVRTQGIYEQEIDSSSLGDPTCNASLEPYFENMQLISKVFRTLDNKWSYKVRIDAVGRFSCIELSASSTYPYQTRYIRKLVIMKFQTIKAGKR